jgi:hypothetical protein
MLIIILFKERFNGIAWCSANLHFSPKTTPSPLSRLGSIVNDSRQLNKMQQIKFHPITGLDIFFINVEILVPEQRQD